MAEVVVLCVVLVVAGGSWIVVSSKLKAIMRRQDLLEQRLRSVQEALELPDTTVSRPVQPRHLSMESEADNPLLRGARPSEQAVAQYEDDPQHNDQAMSRVITLTREGKKIEAIKLYRQTTGAGLKEAKDAVEGMQRQV